MLHSTVLYCKQTSLLFCLLIALCVCVCVCVCSEEQDSEYARRIQEEIQRCADEEAYRREQEDEVRGQTAPRGAHRGFTNDHASIELMTFS